MNGGISPPVLGKHSIVSIEVRYASRSVDKKVSTKRLLTNSINLLSLSSRSCVTFTRPSNLTGFTLVPLP